MSMCAVGIAVVPSEGWLAFNRDGKTSFLLVPRSDSDGRWDLAALADILRSEDVSRVTLGSPAVGPATKPGVALRVGMASGLIAGAVELSGVPWEEVANTSWLDFFSIPRRAPDAVRENAIRLWPEHGHWLREDKGYVLARALHLSRYGYIRLVA